MSVLKPSYEETAKIIKELPMTWCPMLLKLMVETCIEKKAFKPGRLHAFVHSVESKLEPVSTQPEKPWDGQ